MPLLTKFALHGLLAITAVFTLVQHGSRALYADQSIAHQITTKGETYDDRHNSSFSSSEDHHDFGLVVAHCGEDYVSWIDDVESVTVPPGKAKKAASVQAKWDVAIYERCGSTIVPEKYRRWQRNYGSEECTAYLQYIIDNYDRLPKIVYFLQADAIVSKGDKIPHTNFKSLQELVDASAPLLDGHVQQGSSPGFVNVGDKDIIDLKELYYHVNNPAEEVDPSTIIDMMNGQAPPYTKDTKTRSRSGACFGVHRDAIRRNPLSFYKDLFMLELKYADERLVCWALEQLWHVIFGMQYVLPDKTLNAVLKKH